MPATVSVFDALGVIADFNEELASGELTSESRRELFLLHLRKMDKLNFTLPHFKQGLDWLNVSEALSWNDSLKGQIVVLDFFTYCCVNCMHILPDLRVLEEKHPPNSGLVVLGVHSAKFDNEKVTANILSAILRYDIRHAVVNDADATLWQELSVACWPTLIFVGPDNQLLYTIVGEGHRDEMLEFVAIAKEHYKTTGQLLPKSLPVHLERDKVTESALSFPGKVFHWSVRDWLVISDTGNHRIIITDKHGIVQMTIGGKEPGFQDGSLVESRFSSPQGVGCVGDSVYVADTGNHAIRVIDLSAGTVSTVAGTGRQGMDKDGGQFGTQQEIASPWDLVLSHLKDKDDVDMLLVAMAGTHQIWGYFLEDVTWYNGRSFGKNTCVRLAGSGAEENRNNSYPEKAGFAQPSGLALSKPKNTLYIADSESSSIRALNLSNGKVSRVVGGENDPMNLFAYGDFDGIGVKAKLQHPLGVALLSPEGPLVVADSYNHKLKIVDLDGFACDNLDLNSQSSGQLNEPGGLDVDQANKTIYIADTNNHAIKVFEYQTKTLYQLPIVFPVEDVCETDVRRNASEPQGLTFLPDVTIEKTDTRVQLAFPLLLGDGEHLNMQAPNSYKISPVGDSSPDITSLISDLNRKGRLIDMDTGTSKISIPLKADHPPGRYKMQLSVQIFVCLDEGDVCLPPRWTHFKQTIHVE